MIFFRKFLVIFTFVSCSIQVFSQDSATPDKRLICSALNGLCNRLRNLASCAVLAEHSGRELVVCWMNEKNINDCKTIGFTQWSDLFDSPRFQLITLWPKEGVIFGGNPSYGSPYLTQRWLERIPSHTYIEEAWYSQSHLPGAENEIDISLPDKNVIVHTIHNVKPMDMSENEFYERKKGFYNKLVPIPSIAKTVQRISSHFPSDIVGVHVRTTDMLQVHKKENAAIWKYMEYMKEEIAKNPNVKFFVSSDSKLVLRHFRKYFKGKVFFNDQVEFNSHGEVERGTVKATQNALIDLILLSKTKRLIGTRFSSFSYEAACMGGIPIVNEVVH